MFAKIGPDKRERDECLSTREKGAEIRLRIEIAASIIDSKRGNSAFRVCVYGSCCPVKSIGRQRVLFAARCLVLLLQNTWSTRRTHRGLAAGITSLIRNDIRRHHVLFLNTIVKTSTRSHITETSLSGPDKRLTSWERYTSSIMPLVSSARHQLFHKPD